MNSVTDTDCTKNSEKVILESTSVTPQPLAKHQENLVMVLRYFNKTAVSISMYNYHSTVMSEFKYYKHLASIME